MGERLLFAILVTAFGFFLSFFTSNTFGIFILMMLLSTAHGAYRGLKNIEKDESDE